MAGEIDDPRSDEQLIDACNDGDEHAFEAMYRRYRDHVVRLAYRFTHDRDAALDVMQETFLYLLGKFPGFELRAKLTTFLYPVVRHNALAARRKQQRFAGDPASLDGVPDPSHPKANADNLAGALAGLSTEHREIVLLRFVDGMTLEEIAEALSVPLGTVKSRLHHAIAKLRADPGLKKYFER